MSSDEKNRYPLIPVSCPADCDFESNVLATYGYEAKLFSNACIRSLNSIYYNAPHVKPGDEGDFVGYCLSSLGIICGNQEHAFEKIFLPVLQKKYDLTPLIQQYASYKDRITALGNYLKTVTAKGSYNGQKVQELLDSFGAELVKTLHDKINAFSAERLKEYDENDIRGAIQTHRALLEKLIAETPMAVFAVTHHDLKTAPTWPCQVKYIGPVDQLKVYSDTQGYWKFAPYSVKYNGETQTYA